MAANNTFRKIGEYWTVAYEGRAVHLKDAKGLHYLARLLSRPGERLHATELVGDHAGGSATAEDEGVRAERARINVQRAIATALKKITAHHAPLGAHLARTVKTGTLSSYAPDPRAPIEWQT